METIVEVPVAVPDTSRVELETEISHYKGLLKETESMLERLQVSVLVFYFSLSHFEHSFMVSPS